MELDIDKIKHSCVCKEEFLSHHGIKGQKWGVRRFQNVDGTLTSAGKKRYSGGGAESSENTSSKKETIKKIATGAAVSTSIAAAAYLYVNNKSAIDDAVRTAMVSMQMNTGAIMAGAKVNPKVAAGKKAATKFMADSAKRGISKVISTEIQGATILATKKVLDKIVSEEKSDALLKSYNAFNKKNKVNIDGVKNLFGGKEGNDEDDDD